MSISTSRAGGSARKRRYNDRLLMFLLRAHQPERYSRANLATAPQVAPAPLPLPVAEALVALAPVMPSDPHLLLPPDRLESELFVADLMEGELPHYYREHDLGAPYGENPTFEEKLEALKHQRDPLSYDRDRLSDDAAKDDAWDDDEDDADET